MRGEILHSWARPLLEEPSASFALWLAAEKLKIIGTQVTAALNLAAPQGPLSFAYGAKAVAS